MKPVCFEIYRYICKAKVDKGDPFWFWEPYTQ